MKRTAIPGKVTRAEARLVLRRIMDRAIKKHADGEIGDEELMAITQGTAVVLDAEGLGPIQKKADA